MKRPYQKYQTAAVGLLLFVFLALAVTSSYVTRLKLGPDEPAHFIYVRSIAQGHGIPSISHKITPNEKSRSTHQAQHPPLYYGLAAIPYWVSERFVANPEQIWKILRLFTVLIGLGWVYVSYRLAHEFFGQDHFAALAATSFVAFLPNVVYISGVVNNDALAGLTCTLGIWLMLRALRRNSLRSRQAIWLGAAVGLAILTKAQGLALVPSLLATGWAIALRNTGNEARAAVRGCVLTLATAAVVCGVWFVRNQIIYGEFLAQSLHSPLTDMSPFSLVPYPSVWGVLVTAISKQLLSTTWAPAWLVESFPTARVFSVCTLTAFCLIATARLVQVSRTRENAGHVGDRAVLLIPMLLPVCIYISTVYQTIFVDQGVLQQGRVLLPSVGVLSIWFVSGIKRLFPAKLVHPALACVMAASLIGSLLTIYWINSFYLYVQP